MDLIVQTNADSLARMLERLKFEVAYIQGYYSGTRKENGNRMHILFKQISENEVYCDIHLDHRLHFLSLGVDYKDAPKLFFDREFKSVLENENTPHRVEGGFSWSSRRNKALLRGLRI